MPEANAPQGADAAALKPDPGAIIPRMSLGENGITGLKILNRRIYQEAQAAFRYPAFIATVNEMRNNPTVGAAMNVYRMMMSRVTWDVVPPVDATPQDTARANAVKSMMDDMDGSWASFIESVIPYLEYGFAVNEIVLRRRLKRNGSKFNDGLVGIKKLAPRSQETISGWVYTDDRQELIGIEQSLRNVENSYLWQNKLDDRGMLRLDRDKCLLFTASGTVGNPEGNSIYKNIYLAFKQLTTLQNQELLGIAKDVQGILKIAIPPKYLAADASPEEKASLVAFQQIIDNYNAGTARGLLVPNMIDPESKLPLYTYELMESKGQAKYDTEEIIKRLQNDILSALSVDILKLGTNGEGSFSLAESKTSVLALAIDYRLREIREVLNNHLMRLIYEMNGWDASNTAKFDYSDIEEVSLEEFSKAIQRIASTSMIEVDREVMNRIRKVLGISPRPDDEPVDEEKLSATLTGQKSGASEGMAVGTSGEGTAKKPSGKDKSSDNKDNSA